jgi:hypothetical protein
VSKTYKKTLDILAAEAKRQSQDLIRAKWGFKVESEQARLCVACKWLALTEIPCSHNLLPITLSSEVCPYYEKRN